MPDDDFVSFDGERELLGEALEVLEVVLEVEGAMELEGVLVLLDEVLESSTV